MIPSLPCLQEMQKIDLTGKLHVLRTITDHVILYFYFLFHITSFHFENEKPGVFSLMAYRWIFYPCS